MIFSYAYIHAGKDCRVLSVASLHSKHGYDQNQKLDHYISNTETLRRKLAVALKVTEDKVDLIESPRVGFAMRALVAEEGISLKGEDTLAWNHFLGRVWRELEDYEWDKEYAAFYWCQ